MPSVQTSKQTNKHQNKKNNKLLELTHLIEFILGRDPQIGVDGALQSLDYPVGIHVCSLPRFLLCFYHIHVALATVCALKSAKR